MAWLGPKRQHVLAALACGAVAAAARLYDLGGESLWLDEATTFEWASRGPAALIDRARAGEHNPAYFLFMHYWMVLGDGERMLRLPSAIFGTAAVIAVYTLGAIVGGARSGAFAALLTALNGEQVRYGQEARMYAMACFGTAVAGAGLAWLAANPEAAVRRLSPVLSRVAPGARSIDGPGKAWAAFVLGTAFALYMHNTVVLFLVAANLAWLIVVWSAPTPRKGLAQRWLVANAIVAAVFAPWAVSLVAQANRVADGFWIRFPSGTQVLATIENLYLFGQAAWVGPALALGAGAGAWTLRKRPALLGVLVILSVGAPALVLLASVHTPIFIARIMLWGPPFFFVLCGTGLSAVRSPLPATAAILGVLAAGILGLRPYYANRSKPAWDDIARAIASRAAPEEVVLAVDGLSRKPLDYYFNRRDAPIGPRTIYVARSRKPLPRAVERATAVWFVAPHRGGATAERRRHARVVASLLRQNFTDATRIDVARRIEVHRFAGRRSRPPD